MRKLFAWAVVSLGIAALVRKLRGRGDADQPPAASKDDPAEELRQKLAETREDEVPAETLEDEMPIPGEPPQPEPSLDERRAEVHKEGRAAIGDMQRSDED